MAQPGEIWLDPQYYFSDNVARPKYLVVLGIGGGFITYRLLTSQQHGRPAQHVCYADQTYPAFYFGVLNANGGLGGQSWLDLRGADDIDDRQFAVLSRQGRLTLIGCVPRDLLCPALLCAANAQDTTTAQERRIYAARGMLACP